MVLEDVPGFVCSLIAVCRSVDCNIRAVLLDCEFFSTRVLGTLGRMDVGYRAVQEHTRRVALRIICSVNFI